MTTNYIVYGPHGVYTRADFYYWNETELDYGYVLNDANDSIGWGVQFQKTGTIDTVGLYVVEYEGTPNYAMTLTTISGTPGSYNESLPAVDPDTRITTHYSNAEWQDFDPLVVGSGWSWIDLATPVNVTKGDIAAIVVIPSGATIPDSSNYVELNEESTFSDTFPGQWRFTTGWYHYNWKPPIAIKYSDTTIQGHALVGLPYEEYVSPEEWGLEFQLPVQATCVGAIFNLYPSTGGPDSPFKLILADSSDGELASITITDFGYVSSTDNYPSHLSWDTATDPILDPNVTYRLYLKPTSDESVNKYGFILDAEASKAGLPGGTDWKWIERSTPASGWTYKTDHYPWLSLALIDLTSAGGGSGGEGGAGNSSYGFIG